MPEPSDDYEPAGADIDMIVEDFTAKPVKLANLAAGIASMRQRIAQLEAGENVAPARVHKVLWRQTISRSSCGDKTWIVN